jgi:protease-4
MNKKQFMWFLLAMVIFVVTGFAGVNSALSARERSVELAEKAAGMFSGMSEGKLDLPSEPYVAKVPVEGTIADTGSSVGLQGGGYDHEGLLKYIDSLIKDENNVGMLLYIDSPGGEIKAGDELYLKLMDYKEATGRPIWCYFDGTACSGGYYVAMASDEICADRNCICVNIGVYISTYNLSKLFDKYGIEQVNFKSSENKGIGMMGVPWTDEQKEIYQTMVDLMYDQFLDVVAQGRNMTKAQVKQKDDGREMLASQALEAGFIDSIGRYEEYRDSVLERAGVPNLYEYKKTVPAWQELLQYFYSAMPRSDTQALMDFARENSGFVVMAYAG